MMGRTTGGKTIRSLFVASAVLLLCVGGASAEDAGTLTFHEAINQALTANQSFASAQALLEAKQKDVHIAVAGLFPRIGAKGLLSFSESATFSENSGVIPAENLMVGAVLSQMIFNEKTFANWDVQSDLFASQKGQVNNQRLSIIGTAGRAYVSVLLAKALLQVQLKNLELTVENLQIAQAREKAGQATYKEVLRWRSQVYGNKQQVLNQRSNVLVNRFAFNQLRNRPAEETAQLQDLTVAKNGFIFSSAVVAAALPDATKARIIRTFFVDLCLKNSPALQSIDQQIAAQSRQLLSNQLWLVPSAAFTAGADAFLWSSGDGADQASGSKIFWKMGISLNWNLFAGSANVAKMSQASATLEGLRAQRNALASSLEQSARGSVTVVIASYQAIDLARLQAATAAENYQLVRDAYLEGESPLLVMLDAQQQKVGADSALTKAAYTFLSNLLSAEQTIGYFPFLRGPDSVDEHVRNLENRLRGVSPHSGRSAQRPAVN